MFARIIGRTRRFSGFLSIDECRIETETHGGATREVTLLVMERGHAVGVLAYDPARDAVVLANELRVGQLAAGDDPFADALIAGVIGPGESAVEAAIRETQEEAGLALRDARVIHPGAYVSPGGTSERIVLVFGTVDAAGGGGIHGNAHESEDIRTVVLPADVFIARCTRGEISDMKTALAGWWLADYRRTTNAATA